MRSSRSAYPRWMTNEPLPHRFLDPSRPVSVRRANLPHWSLRGVTCFVTFRLADSLPRSALERPRAEVHAAGAIGSTPDRRRSRSTRELHRRIEEWLDRGHGSGILAVQRIGSIVRDSRRHFDGVRHHLDAFAVAPNHVHALLVPASPWSISKILHSWKSYSPHRVRGVLDGSRMHPPSRGAIWQKESFDRIVRDEAHLDRCREYIRRHRGVGATEGLGERGFSMKRRDVASTSLLRLFYVVVRRGESSQEATGRRFHVVSPRFAVTRSSRRPAPSSRGRRGSRERPGRRLRARCVRIPRAAASAARDNARGARADAAGVATD